MLLHNHIPITLPLVKPHHRRTAATASLSISDDSLSSRGFTFHRTADNLNLDHLNSVFTAVGFPRRDPEKIRVALEHTSTPCSPRWDSPGATRRRSEWRWSTPTRCCGWSMRKRNGRWRLLERRGVQRDIWDVVVDPSFQGIGLGKVVMERMVTALLDKGITNIALYAEPRVLGFYKPMGFVADPDGIRGMVYSRKRKNK